MQINFNSQMSFGQVPVLRTIVKNGNKTEEMVVARLEGEDARNEEFLKSLRDKFKHHSNVFAKTQSAGDIEKDFATGDCYVLRSMNDDNTTSLRGFAVCNHDAPDHATINEMHLTDNFMRSNAKTGEQAVCFVVAASKDKNVNWVKANQLPADFKRVATSMFERADQKYNIKTVNGQTFLDGKSIKLFADAISADDYKLYI